MERDYGVLGGPEPDEEATDDLGGRDPEAGTGELGGPEPDEEATDRSAGRIRTRRLLANGA